MTQSDAPNEGREEKHTPGPWAVSKKFPTHVYKWTGKNSFFIIATCDQHGRRDEDKENAKLIARVPDMLNEIKFLREQLSKEREYNKALRQQNDVILDELKREREKNKRLEEGILKFVHHWRIFFNSPKVGQPPNLSDLESLIAKAS